ncbi:hypothetical protein GH714_004182 [Hevea brasiliensis]|uniref:NB-ARC domain-containing protein n=1 Tax=Hevea brasiliensis TaxID=3981 RepID=A0A6A6L0D7_HEVBR|nr:hypothetical protein GH714_004182 [Hevea brasiliensis]
MGWGFQNTPDESRDRDVLDRMKPHENLKKLTMVHYGETWLLNGNVKVVDREFYGEDNLNPFPALETLHFKSMRKWENWNVNEVEFPRLRKLSIIWCPKLLGKLPSHLPSLQNLVIEQCLQLVVSFQRLPLISHLQIEGCRKQELGGGLAQQTSEGLWRIIFISTGRVHARLKKVRNVDYWS